MDNKKEVKPAAKLEPITSKTVLAQISGGSAPRVRHEHVWCRDRINGGEKLDS